MTTNRIVLGATLLAAGCIGLGCANFMQSDQKVIAFEKTPSAVQAGITKVLAGEKADKIVMEDEDGKTVYEVIYHVNGQERSADFTATGEMISQESEVDVASLPAAVSEAILKKYSGAKIEEAAEVTAAGQKYYETGVKLAGGDEHAILVNSDGSIRSDMAEDEDDAGKTEEK